MQGPGSHPATELRLLSDKLRAIKKGARKRSLKTKNCHLRSDNCHQYFGTFGSTRSDHAVMPPARLCTFVKPDCWRNATALALRPPILQWTTISRLESSSCTRFGRSLSGIKCPPMLQIWYSCGSRTSS